MEQAEQTEITVENQLYPFLPEEIDINSILSEEKKETGNYDLFINPLHFFRINNIPHIRSNCLISNYTGSPNSLDVSDFKGLLMKSEIYRSDKACFIRVFDRYNKTERESIPWKWQFDAIFDLKYYSISTNKTPTDDHSITLYCPEHELKFNAKEFTIKRPLIKSFVNDIYMDVANTDHHIYDLYVTYSGIVYPKGLKQKLKDLYYDYSQWLKNLPRK